MTEFPNIKRVESFHGGRLTQAREARGLTKTALANMVGISLNAISDLEKGKSLPKPNTLEELARVTAFSESFFTRDVLPAQSGPVFWRKQASEPMRSQSKTGQRIEWAAEAFLSLSEYLEFPELALTSIANWPEHWSQITDEDIETLAEACRDAWGIGNHPIPDMCLAVENIGIPVLAFDIENDKQSGYSRWMDAIERPIIGVNTLESSCARMRFNLAHELAHMLMHRHSVTETEVKNTKTYPLIEKQAHRFAGALLFPRDSFLRSVQYPSLEEFAAHKQEWGISILAQIARAKNLGVCDTEWATALTIRASKKGYRGKRGEPFDHDTPLEKPRMLRRAVDLLEETSELLLANVRNSLALNRPEELELFGRSLATSHSNVVRLRT